MQRYGFFGLPPNISKKKCSKTCYFSFVWQKRTVLMRFYLLLFTRARVWVCTPTGKGWLSREVARSAWTARANKLFARRKQLERLKKTTWTLEGNKLNAWRKKHSVQLSFCSFRAQSWRDYVTQGVAPGYALIGLSANYDKTRVGLSYLFRRLREDTFYKPRLSIPDKRIVLFLSLLMVILAL